MKISSKPHRGHLKCKLIGLLGLLILGFAAVASGQTRTDTNNAGILNNNEVSVANVNQVGHVCADNFLSASDSHGGTDYGYAISQAVQTLPLLTPSKLYVGCHPSSPDLKVYTQALIDRPVSIYMDGNARLVPQSTLSSTPVTINGAITTAGSAIVTVPSTSGLHVGDQVGGSRDPAWCIYHRHWIGQYHNLSAG
jgi:hypothetical protein